MKTIFLTLALGLSFAAHGGNVDLTKSSFAWKGTKVTGKHIGKVGLQSADLNLGPDGRIKKGQVVIDLNKITVTDLEGEWAEKFLTHIKSADFFDIKKYPTAKLIIISDDGKALKGKMTIRNKTRDVTVKYTKVGKVYSGVLNFNRTKFDMKYGSGSFFKGLGDKMVHDNVSVDFKVVLK
ncbi:MAG: polyisoprenoid-binding protein YceI [Bacteriovoracaceae bacterium]|jgi:polyisoprenoid-binding protein YceI